MSNELIKIDGAEGRFSRDQIELIKRSFGKGLTDDEVQVFIYTCARTGLDPMAKQAYAIKRGGAMTIQVGIDGFRLIAERTGCYAPGRETEYSYDANGNLAWARAYVKKLTKDGTWHEVSATAFRSEYDTAQNLWKKMPATMLEKVAESKVLRKCFPSDLSGIYTKEEMEQAEEVEVIDMTKRTISQEDWDKMDTYLNGHMELRERLKKLCKVDNLRNITYQQLEACRRLAHEYISNLKQLEEETGDAE